MAGIAPAKPTPNLDAYLRWIKAGMHGEMGYMARPDRTARRQDLNVILEDAKSLIIVALDYYSLDLPTEIANDPLRGRISNYAWGLDYHDVMLPRLESLATSLAGWLDRPIGYRAYVDTGAILERDHGTEAGLGFIGKNTMLIHPRRGSYFFLGEIITDVELAYDNANPVTVPNCGTCTRCLDDCPTSAFPQPYVLDARKCISYLTIEHKGFIPYELRPLMGNWVYGCDVCQEVCPWQRFAGPVDSPLLGTVDVEQRAAPTLASLLALNEESFNKQFDDSPVIRIKRERLVRNACIAAGNSGKPELAEYLTPLLDDASPLVRGHAAWALGQLYRRQRELKDALNQETNDQVKREITLALNQFPAA